MKNKLLQKKGGYTIIETMIAVSLFIIITTAGMGSLLNVNLLHQKSRDMRSILDNLSFVMEDISRNLRTGYNYYCITGQDNLFSVSSPQSGQSCWGIAFESASGTSSPNDQWVYYIDNTGKIFKATSGPYNALSFIQLTPDEVVVDVNKSGFVVAGAEPPPDILQPFVNIKLVGSITYQNVVTPFSLQTSVSQRNIDI